MRILIFMFFFLLPFLLFCQVIGKVKDPQGDPLAYVSVYQKNTNNVTVTNADGNFELTLIKQKPTILVFQFLGYKAKEVSVFANEKTLSVVLEQEDFDLSEIVIVAGKEDPAYGIMRKAMANREANQKASSTFSASVYIKGLMKIVDAPKSFMGQDLGDFDGLVDTITRQGILYLSETQSKVYAQHPKKYKEVLESSIVAGDDGGISFNQFSQARFNFYDKSIQFERSFVSPLDDDAFSYYKFRLEESLVDSATNNSFFKIKVVPKNNFRPCFNGYIYINDKYFNIHSLNLTILGSTIKSAVFDTIKIKQVHRADINNPEYWHLLTQVIEFKLGLFVFKAKGTFSYVLSNYEANPSFVPNFFSLELYRAEKNAIKNDSSYWNTKRPIPLTDEERKDYIKKDSLKRIWESKPYLDSIDRVTNKFKLMDIFFGYGGQKSSKKLYYDISSPLFSLQFNAVEGYNLASYGELRKYSKDDSKRLLIGSELRYGFSDKNFKPSLKIDYRYDRFSNARVNLEFGRKLEQFDNRNPISAIGNTYQSLFQKNHFIKLYQKDFIRSFWSGELLNGFYIFGDIEYSKRKNLTLSSNLSYRNKEKTYQPNNPFEVPDGLFTLNSNLLKTGLSLRFRFGQKYMSYPDDKIVLNSSSSEVWFSIENALGLKASFADFTKLKFRFKDDKISMKIYGYSQINFEVGRFLRTKNVTEIDYFHFLSAELLSTFESRYPQSFKLLQYYELSSTNPYATLFYEHHFDGYIMDKIPLINTLGLKMIFGFGAMYRNDIRYIEPGIGLEGFKIGPINLGRIDYYWGFNQNGFRNSGFQIGLSAFFEQMNRRG